MTSLADTPGGSLCILVRRPPYGTIHAAEALRHAGGALGEGLDVAVALVDDGVYLARDGQNVGDTGYTGLSPVLFKLLAKGARVHVHAPSAQARGLLADEHFVPAIELVDDAGLAGLLAEASTVMVY